MQSRPKPLRGKIVVLVSKIRLADFRPNDATALPRTAFKRGVSRQSNNRLHRLMAMGGNGVDVRNVGGQPKERSALGVPTIGSEHSVGVV